MYRSRKHSKQYSPRKTRSALMNGDATCPFCDLTNHEIIFKDNHNLVIRNNFGYQYWDYMDVIDHLMIVPARHILSLKELTDAEKVSTIDLISAYESRGYNVYAREKDNSAKSVPHQHTHLIKGKPKSSWIYLYLKKPYFVFKK